MLKSVVLLLVASASGTPIHETLPATSKLIAAEPTVLCNLEYETTFYTDYKEIETQECHTEYENICVTETNTVCVESSITKCDLITETKCHTEYSKKCTDQFKIEREPYIETVCETKYQEECEHRWEGEGNDKVWVPIPETCRQEPYEECTDVAKTKERQVAFPVCEDVPHQVCVDVPKEVCHEIPETKCAQKPYEKCHDVPKELCINVHKKIPVKASKKIPKQKCLHTDGYKEPGVIHVPVKPLPYTPVAAPVAVPVAVPAVVPHTVHSVVEPKLPSPPISVNNPKFVAVPANPAAPVAPASTVPLPQFTNGFIRIGRESDLDEHEYEYEDAITTLAPAAEE